MAETVSLELCDVVPQVLEDMGCEPLEGLPVMGGAVHADLAVLSWPRSAPRGSGSAIGGRDDPGRNPLMMVAVQREEGGGG